MCTAKFVKRLVLFETKLPNNRQQLSLQTHLLGLLHVHVSANSCEADMRYPNRLPGVATAAEQDLKVYQFMKVDSPHITHQPHHFIVLEMHIFTFDAISYVQANSQRLPAQRCFGQPK